MSDRHTTGPAQTPSLVFLVRDVLFEFNGRPALWDLRIEGRQGDIIGLIGPPGGGKTTLIHLLLGRLKPSSGNIWILGDIPSRLKTKRNQIGVSPQRLQEDFSPGLTAFDFVLDGVLPVELSRRRRALAVERVEAALALVNAETPPRSLMTDLDPTALWRVRLARALVNEPEFLILDELGAELPSPQRRELFKRVGEIHRERGLTSLVIAEDLKAIVDIVHEVIYLNGTVRFRGNPDEVPPEYLDYRIR